VIRRCIYAANAKLIYQRHGIVLAEALGTVVLAVIKIDLVRDAVLLNTQAEAFLDSGCVRVGVPNQERHNMVGPSAKEHRQPRPDRSGSLRILDEYVDKMMVGEPDVIRGDIKFGPLHAGKSVVESLWAFTIIKDGIVGNCADFALKSLT
jgi:hypothetical protein